MKPPSNRCTVGWCMHQKIPQSTNKAYKKYGALKLDETIEYKTADDT